MFSINIIRMRLKQFLETFSEDRYIPTKDEIRHFNQVRVGGKVDYSKDLLNVVLKKLYNITLKISEEKIRNKFSQTIFRNMGDLTQLIKAVKKLNSENRTNVTDALSEFLNKIEKEN